jgi:hypothetical protein
MKNIIKWLENLEELKPVPAGIPTQINKIEGIKAVIFDIVGGRNQQCSINIENDGFYSLNFVELRKDS